MTRNHRQEALSRAYVQAIAAQAGLGYSVPTPDYGIDLTLRSIQLQRSQRIDVGVALDLQLKSTTRAVVSEAEVLYDLEVRTYEHLRAAFPVYRRILVVLVLPEDEARWLSQSPEELILRHCAYWLSLRGAEPTTATSTLRVAIPRAQVFSVSAVRDLMNRLSLGETL